MECHYFPCFPSRHYIFHTSSYNFELKMNWNWHDVERSLSPLFKNLNCSVKITKNHKYCPTQIFKTKSPVIHSKLVCKCGCLYQFRLICMKLISAWPPKGGVVQPPPPVDPHSLRKLATWRKPLKRKINALQNLKPNSRPHQISWVTKTHNVWKLPKKSHFCEWSELR